MEQVVQKIETAPPAEPSKQVEEKVSPPKVDYATDLFNMLSMDGSGENTTGASGDDNTWAGFQCMSELSCNFWCWILYMFCVFSPVFCGLRVGEECLQALKKFIATLVLAI